MVDPNEAQEALVQTDEALASLGTPLEREYLLHHAAVRARRVLLALVDAQKPTDDAVSFDGLTDQVAQHWTADERRVHDAAVRVFEGEMAARVIDADVEESDE
jgi:chaperone required for assembly of F1-ATPase|tara:strand:+ start:29592 stop:29900 length:309 start_codon:yes stop_codon:yes gene_type:complete